MKESDFKNYLLTYLHLPYLWGGSTPIAGLDCSGAVQEWLAALGLDPAGDQTAQALYNHFKSLPHSDFLKTGALCFYGKNPQSITHVAMLFDPYTIIEAGGGGSATTSEAAAIRQNAFIRLRSVEKRKDLVEVILPQALPLLRDV